MSPELRQPFGVVFPAGPKVPGTPPAPHCEHWQEWNLRSNFTRCPCGTFSHFILPRAIGAALKERE